MTSLEQLRRVLEARLGRPRPIYAHYGVTHRCNMRCRMCIVWKSANRHEELAVEQAGELARNLWTAGVRAVALGGGEPFVRADLPDLAAAFSGTGIEVRVLTNGIGITEDRAAAVVAAGVRHVSISLDTVDPRKEQSIYDGHDVWHDILRSMRLFRALLPGQGSAPVMNVCVSRLNLDELPELVALAEREGFLCSFVPIALAEDETQSDGFAGVAPDLAIRAEDRARLEVSYDTLIHLKRKGAPIANSTRFLRDARDYLLTGRTPWECDAGALYLSVSPAGGISICHRFEPFARYDSTDLAERLRSVAFRDEVQRRRADCPGCMRPCWAEVTHAMHDLPSGMEAWRLVRRKRRPA